MFLLSRDYQLAPCPDYRDTAKEDSEAGDEGDVARELVRREELFAREPGERAFVVGHVAARASKCGLSGLVAAGHLSNKRVVGI